MYRTRQGSLPCVKGGGRGDIRFTEIGEVGGIVLPPRQYIRTHHENCPTLHYWEYAPLVYRIPLNSLFFLYLLTFPNHDNAGSHPIPPPILLEHNKIKNVSPYHLLACKTNRVRAQKIIPKMTFLFGHIFTQFLCVRDVIFIVFSVHNNPPPPYGRSPLCTRGPFLYPTYYLPTQKSAKTRSTTASVARCPVSSRMAFRAPSMLTDTASRVIPQSRAADASCRQVSAVAAHCR